MKLKKKPKIILCVIFLLIIVTLVIFAITKISSKKEPEPVKILKTIEAYQYDLKENKPQRYKDLFKELEKILLADEIDNEAYVKKISEMFIYDFYSLKDKTTKTDVGGVDFIHKDALQNFLVNAENTYYKYVESNLYDERNQELPVVDKITIESITPTEYVYNKAKYDAFEVKVTWTYTDNRFNDYQSSATLVFAKEDIKYNLMELQ